MKQALWHLIINFLSAILFWSSLRSRTMFGLRQASHSPSASRIWHG